MYRVLRIDGQRKIWTTDINFSDSIDLIHLIILLCAEPINYCLPPVVRPLVDLRNKNRTRVAYFAIIKSLKVIGPLFLGLDG